MNYIAEHDVCEHGQDGFCDDLIKCKAGFTCMFKKAGGLGKCCKSGDTGVGGIVGLPDLVVNILPGRLL